MNKFYVLITTLLISSFSLMSLEKCNTKNAKKNLIERGFPLDDKKIQSGYGEPARIDVTEDWDLFINASFIYWQPLEKGLTIAVDDQYTYNYSSGFNDTNKLIEMDFDWKPGFKVGLGKGFKYDNWVLAADYTWFHNTNQKKATSANSTLESLWTRTLTGGASEVWGKWFLDFDEVNLFLSRPFYLGECFLVNPFGGLNFTKINQKFHSYEYDNEFIEEIVFIIKPDGSIVIEHRTAHIIENLKEKIKSKSWLIGPKLGVDGKWFFAKNFWLNTNINGGLAYQKFKLTSNGLDRVNSEVRSTGTTKHTFGRLTPFLNADLGLSTGTYFYDNRLHFEFNLLYTFKIFWSQNYMKNMHYSSWGSGGEPNQSAEDLFMHGLTANARFDF